MKVYLNRKPKFGPWGGGTKIVAELSKKLRELNIEIVYQLGPHIDIIFCFDPRPNEFGERYQHFLEHRRKYNTRIIQRVGDLGTHSKPQLTELVEQTINLSDYVIFPSLWAKERIGFKGNNYKIINNKPLPIFHKNKKKNLTLKDKIKLVTHHWSTNPKKGFDLYQKLDEYLKNNDKYECSYIGRIPENIKFKNIRHISPVDSQRLAEILPEQDIYITASLEEAGANHVLEAMAAGLPVIYHKDGGSIVNYCENYGEEYSSFEQLLKKIESVSNNYEHYKSSVLRYSETTNEVVKEYVDIICTK